ncbi:MAG TPA: hypothetical protein VJ276_23350 [Thermoanaerobaculia bacterium]|nr:hypothetical protein [Thermoanaerobaculia bacterium]
MIPHDLLASRRGRTLVAAGIALLFLALRLALLFAREPFFDELFTRWIAAKSFAGILEALRHDSGPPLYYFVAHLIRSITLLRFFSLLCATAAFLLVLRRNLAAAALLAVYPPAVLLAVDARSYAMAALLLTIAVLAIDADRPLLATVALVLACYTHYYAVLFLPLLLVRRWFLSFALACALFVPGLLLALRQPREATAWLAESHFDSLINVSFAGNYAEALFAPAPPWLVVVALLVLVVACSPSSALRAPSPRIGGEKALEEPSPRVRGFAAAVLIPIAGAIAFGLFGRPIYFPMRFESVIAAPLVLWTAFSLERWQPAVRRILFAALMLIGLVVTWRGIIDHVRRALDPFRAAALVAARQPGPLVASGYAWLEVASTGREVIAWPPEQAKHPGWRARAQEGTLPAGTFIWVGEVGAPELRHRKVRPIFVDRGVAVLRVD